MLRPADKLPTEMRLRLARGGANDRASLASSLSATPLQEQHAALCSRNKPPDRIGRRLAFTLRKCQDKSRVENCGAVENFFTSLGEVRDLEIAAPGAQSAVPRERDATIFHDAPE